MRGQGRGREGGGGGGGSRKPCTLAAMSVVDARCARIRFSLGGTTVQSGPFPECQSAGQNKGVTSKTRRSGVQIFGKFTFYNDKRSELFYAKTVKRKK